MKKRPFEVLFVIAIIAVVVGWFDFTPQTQPQTAADKMALTDPGIGYEVTFNRLRPGMTKQQAETIYGPPDYTRGIKNYQQWERPLTQVYYDDQGVLTEVGGSGRGQLFLGDRVIFQCGMPESAIEQTFGPPLSVEDGEYSYPGMVLFCGTASAEQRWVSSIVLGSHE